VTATGRERGARSASYDEAFVRLAASRLARILLKFKPLTQHELEWRLTVEPVLLEERRRSRSRRSR
jgi:hypothetical protein